MFSQDSFVSCYQIIQNQGYSVMDGKFNPLRSLFLMVMIQGGQLSALLFLNFSKFHCLNPLPFSCKYLSSETSTHLLIFSTLKIMFSVSQITAHRIQPTSRSKSHWQPYFTLPQTTIAPQLPAYNSMHPPKPSLPTPIPPSFTPHLKNFIHLPSGSSGPAL